ncbi:MAG: PEPxxWA-CTERM sorting domain-containing protein [Phenylobacterium sp.]
MQLSTTLKALAAAAALGLGALTAAPAAAATPGIVLDDNFATFAGGDWTMGWAFEVTTSQQLLGLGAFDYQEDGLYLDHEVGIWDASGALLASVVVTSADPLISGYRFASIAPLTLKAGSTYVVGAADYGFYRDPIPVVGTMTIAPGVTYLESRYFRGTGLHLPEGVMTGSQPAGNILLGSAVPEPATWAMMIIGFGAAGAMVRASRRRLASAASA